jgi:hypothetical protein
MGDVCLEFPYTCHGHFETALVTRAYNNWDWYVRRTNQVPARCRSC